MRAGHHKLFHDLEVDLLHVHLLIELGRKFGGLEKSCIYAGRHGGQERERRGCTSAVITKDGQEKGEGEGEVTSIAPSAPIQKRDAEVRSSQVRTRVLWG